MVSLLLSHKAEVNALMRGNGDAKRWKDKVDQTPLSDAITNVDDADGGIDPVALLQPYS